MCKTINELSLFTFAQNFILYILTSNDCKSNNFLYLANLEDSLLEAYSLSRNFEEIWSNSYDIYYVHWWIFLWHGLY